MWHRNEARPTRYGDIMFKSALEAKVAEELDDFRVIWEYEKKADETPELGYLPDFTIVQAWDDLELPQWIEVKPADLLYAIRDKAGLDEHFTGSFTFGLTAADLLDAGFPEAAKPKALAERSGLGVLITAKLNRSRTISVLAAPDHIVISREHPAVCWQSVVKERERQLRQAQYAAEAEQREAERAAREADRWNLVVQTARTDGRPARFSGRCWACGQEEVAAELLIFRTDDDRWASCCRTHLTETEVRS